MRYPLPYPLILISLLVLGYSCLWNNSAAEENILETYQVDTVGAIRARDILPVPVMVEKTEPHASLTPVDTSKLPPKTGLVQWGKTIPLNEIVDFAQTLLGTPYRYGSTDPAEGFDCSGFITYVFNHFGLKVPRSSVEFTNRGTEVPVSLAKKGDLILFTGTDSTSHTVGHMGIVVDHSDSLRFIHSSSGKAHGVTITALNGYYQKRFVKIIALDQGL